MTAAAPALRGITVRQPWAWAILHAGKNVENRTRNIAGAYRGPLAVHAGLREDDQAYYDDLIKDAFGRYDDSWLLAEQLVPGGAIIGLVDLVDVHNFGTHACASPWAKYGAVHLVLANPRPLPAPIPCRGRLGLWTPPADVLKQLQAAA